MSRYAWHSGVHTRVQRFMTVVHLSLFLLLLNLSLLTVTYQPLVTARATGTVNTPAHKVPTLPLRRSDVSDTDSNNGSHLPELINTSPLYTLVTQLMVTSLIGAGCFLLFCITRTRWPMVFAPKELARTVTPISCLPKTFFGWITSVLRLRESQVLAVLGPDAVMFLRLWHLGTRLFAVLSICGTLILIPANIVASYYGSEDDQNRVPLSMDIVPSKSAFLILHLLFIYFFTGIVCHYLHREYVAFVNLRRHFLIRTNPGVHSRTVMVTGLPSDLRMDEGAALRSFFEGLGVGKVKRACVMPITTKLEMALHERAEALRALEKAYVKWINKRQRAEYRYQSSRYQLSSGEASALLRSASTSSRPTIRTSYPSGVEDGIRWIQWLTCNGLFGLCGSSDGIQGEMVDAIDHYTAQFNELDKRVRRLRRGTFEQSNTGFVTFKTQSSANIVAQTLNTDRPLSCLTSMAPEYRDIYWPNISMPPLQKGTRSALIQAAVILVVLTWSIPITTVNAVANLESLYKLIPAIKPIFSLSPVITGLIEGFLPTLAASIMVYLLRTTFEQLSMVEGHRTYSGIELSTMSKYFLFQLVNIVFIQIVASITLDTITKITDHPGSILDRIGNSFPKAAPFFINYTLLQGLVVLPATELLQVSSIFTHLVHLVASWTPREQAEHDTPPPPKYGWLYPLPTLLFIVGLTFSVTAPIILPAATLFFFIGRLIFSYQFARVYQPQYEAGGRAWPVIFRRLIVGLILFQLSTAALLLLKGKKLYVLLALPSLVITLLFAAYCIRVYESQSSYLPLDVASGMARQEEALYENEDDDDDDDDDNDDDDTNSLPEAQLGYNNNNRHSTPITTTGWHPESRRGRGGLFGFGRRSESSNDVRTARREDDEDDEDNGLSNNANTWSKRIKRVVSAATPDFPSMSSIRSNVTQVMRSADPQAQPPMTRIDGVLDTELTQYAHLAVKGELPQPWPPAGLHIRQRGGIRSFFSL